MKNIENYFHTKYNQEPYTQIEDGIYKIEDSYVTSLSFQQEPEYEEGLDASEISQYPLEDLLDKYLCYISDFYEDLNLEGNQTCYLEFAAPNIEAIRDIREIIGKHVYIATVEEDGQLYDTLKIE